MNELLTIKTDFTPSFKNFELNIATDEIIGLATGIRTNFYGIAKVISRIENEKLYAEDGFKNVIEYSEKTFGFKKTMSYSLLKIGTEYINDELESILPHDEGNDFSVTQIEKLLPLKDKEKAIELINDGKISPTMSCKEIENVVKSVNSKPIKNKKSLSIKVEKYDISLKETGFRETVFGNIDLDTILKECYSYSQTKTETGFNLFIEYQDRVVLYKLTKKVSGQPEEGEDSEPLNDSENNDQMDTLIV